MQQKKWPPFYYTWLDRTRRADSEYVLCISFWSSFGCENLKIQSALRKERFLPFLEKFKISPLYTHRHFLKLFYSDSAPQSEYNHVSLCDFSHNYHVRRCQKEWTSDIVATCSRKRYSSLVSDFPPSCYTSIQSSSNSHTRYPIPF